MLKLIKENQGHLVATIIVFALFIATGLIVTSARFNYALDYELNILTNDCTYAKYVENKSSCIKPEYD